MRIEGRKAFRGMHWSREGFKARGGLGRSRLEKVSIDTKRQSRLKELVKYLSSLTRELHPSCDTIMEVRMCWFRMPRALTSSSGDCPRSLFCSLEGLCHHHANLQQRLLVFPWRGLGGQHRGSEPSKARS